jgi:class 3 adenylate cyclase
VWSSLFTDIVGSTEKAVALGDAAWAELLERHHAVVRAELTRLGGREMDTSGDVFFKDFALRLIKIQALSWTS